jgi:urease accessory protein
VETVAAVRPRFPAGIDSPERLRGWPDGEISVRFRRGVGGKVRVEGVLCSAPLWLRWDGTTLWLVGSGAAPVGNDHVSLRVDVGAGVAVAVRSVAATVIYAGYGSGTRWDTDIRVADGARLDWRPDPVILTGRACHQSTTTVRAATGADVTLDEIVVLGRGDETGGALRATVEASIDDTAVVCTSMDTSLPGWSGPAGIDGASVIANRLRLGAAGAGASSRVAPRPHAACRSSLLEPTPACRMAVAMADDVTEVRTSLDAVLPA